MIWRLLLAFLSFGVVDPNAEVPVEAVNAAEDRPEGSTVEGEEGTEGEPEGGIEEAIEASGEIEAPTEKPKYRQSDIDKAAEEGARRAIATSQPPRQPAPNFEQQTRQREDAEIEALQRSGADAQVIAEKQWEINTNRTLRQSDNNSRMAMFQAMDFNDKGEFRELALDPKKAPIYQAYKDRVEKALAEMRQNGTNAPRMTILKYLMGEDRIEGRIKTKPTTKKTTETLPQNVTRINRGRAPGVGARGDVRAGSGRPTAKQEAEKRLMNADGTYKRI